MRWAWLVRGWVWVPSAWLLPSEDWFSQGDASLLCLWPVPAVPSLTLTRRRTIPIMEGNCFHIQGRNAGVQGTRPPLTEGTLSNLVCECTWPGVQPAPSGPSDAYCGYLNDIYLYFTLLFNPEQFYLSNGLCVIGKFCLLFCFIYY